MPIYEFQCNKCKNQFEIIAKSGQINFNCPKCYSDDLKKLVSAIASKPSKCSSSCNNCHNCH